MNSSPRPGSWVRDLTPDERERGTDPACSAATITHFREVLGRKPVEWGTQTARDIVADLAETIPEFTYGTSQHLALHLGVESAVLEVLSSVATGQVVPAGESAEVRQSAREYVYKRISLPTVLTTVRRAHSSLMDKLMRECTDLVAANRQAAELMTLSRIAFEFVDRLSAAIGSAYVDEYDRWLSAANAARDEAVHALIDGKDIDPRAASRALRYQVEDRQHVALLLWQAPDFASDFASETSLLHPTALGYLRALGAEGTLIVPQGRTLLWAWGSRRCAFPDQYRARPYDGEPGLRIAVGTPGPGPAGFRQSHLDAMATMNVARYPGIAQNTLIHHRDVSLLAILMTNAPAAELFAQRELSSLAASDPHTREIRRTVRSYLETRSPQSSAEHLHIARNTVSYRLKQAASMIGHPVHERRLELWTAIVIADLMWGDGDLLR